MRIRPATPADVPAITRLLADAFPEHLRGLLTLTQPRSGKYLEVVLAHRHTQPARHDLVVCEGGNVLAYADLRLPTAGQAFLAHVCVSPEVRGRRLAPRLLAAFCAEQEVDELELDVFADNSGARRLYERLGLGEAARTAWWVRPLPPAAATGTVGLPDYPMSSAAFERFGFCELTVDRGGERYSVGRTGDHLRLRRREDYEDDALLADIVRVLPEVFAAFLTLPAEEPSPRGERIVTSLRLRGSTDRLRKDYSR